ncbi:MAG: site-2 protease family protein [Nanoarchaeota archaeon]|nr:site-2 protease family protein [Nanoarchaeota archaeon]
MNLDLISAVIFYAVIALLIYKYRARIKIMNKVFITYRTKKGLEFMRRLAEYRVFWKIFSTIAIPVVVFGMLLVGVSLFQNLLKIIQGTGGQGVELLLPGITVPFWPSIIAIGVLIIVHEFSHGIVAAMEGIRLKSTGVGLFAFLPLAFVELDEKQMLTKSKLSRLRILSSGPFANIVMWGILIGFISLVLAPVMNNIIINDGANITSLDINAPAYNAGLKEGDVIVSVNNVSIATISDFINAMKDVHPGDAVTITTLNGTFTFNTSVNPQDSSRPYIGVVVTQAYHISSSAKEKYGFWVDVFIWLFGVIKWVALINLFVGLINCIPVWAIDGGRVLYDLLGYVINNDKVRLWIVNATSAFYITLIVFNFIGPWLVKLVG